MAVDEYGPGPRVLHLPEQEARKRLDMILSDRLLRFNPYRVNDKELVECAMRGRWLPFPSLTQMVVIHFGKLTYKLEGIEGKNISFRIGNDPMEYEMPIWRLIRQLTTIASRQFARPQVNGRNISNLGIAEHMQGKSYFVSHMIPAESHGGGAASAYRMFSLRGNEERMAAVIRRRMIESKLIMLEDILKFPYSPAYLHCKRNLFDYTTPIQRAMEAIRRFPDISSNT